MGIRVYIFLLTMMASLSMTFAPIALARPITEWNEKNRIELEEHFQEYKNVFPELFVSHNIPFDSQYYFAYLYFKRNNRLQNIWLDNFTKTPTKLQTVDLLFALYPKEHKRTSTLQAYDIKQHPREKDLLQYLQSGLFALDKKKNISPDMAITIEDFNRMLKIWGIPEIRQNIRTLIYADIIQYLYEYEKKQLLYTWDDFAKNKPKIEMKDRQFYINEKPFSGIMVKWLLNDQTQKTEFEIRSEIKKMKSYGIRGIATEIGWKETMASSTQFQLPTHFDTLFRVAEQEGMLMSVLLSAHYTPEWLFRKYKQDIRMIDRNGNPAPEGEYITFSLNSPAVYDQIDFQKRTITALQKYSNIMSYFLSNEISYGKTYDVDFSPWIENAWHIWQKKQGWKTTPMPKKINDPVSKDWLRFRQINLTNYLNTLYREVKKAHPNKYITHKMIPYESTSFYAQNYGVHPSPKELELDFFATDVYGMTPNTYAFQHAFPGSKFVVETNLPGDWDAISMYHYLALNYLHGIKVQTVFQWNCGSHENVLFWCDGSAWKKTAGIKMAAEFIFAVQNLPTTKPNSAVILPTESINRDGQNFKVNQYAIDDAVVRLFRMTKQYPMILWADDLTYDTYGNDGFPLYTNDELKSIDYIILPRQKFDTSNRFPQLTGGYTTKDGYFWRRK